MFMWSARASESSGVIGPTSLRTRPRLSSSRVRSAGSSGSSEVRASTSVNRLSLARVMEGVAPIVSRRTFRQPPEQVFDFLADLSNHWLLDDAFVELDGSGNGRRR